MQQGWFATALGFAGLDSQRCQLIVPLSGFFGEQPSRTDRPDYPLSSSNSSSVFTRAMPERESDMA